MRTIISMVFLALIVSVILAFAGVEPLSTAKDDIISFFHSEATPTSTYTSGSTATPRIIPTKIPTPTLRDPSWDELVTFLASDQTDEHDYIYGSFVCADFANMLHDNAEAAGIRVAIVTVELSGYPDYYNYGIPSNTGHALNAFDTTDYGLVYIDDTGLPGGSSCSADKIVDVSVGNEYIAESIFPCTWQSSTWPSVGTVTNVDIQW